MQSTAQPGAPELPLTLAKLVPTIRALSTLDKLRLIPILAEELEEAKDILLSECGDSVDAADVLAAAMTESRKAGR
jgi:hypothetical protein